MIRLETYYSGETYERYEIIRLGNYVWSGITWGDHMIETSGDDVTNEGESASGDVYERCLVSATGTTNDTSQLF